MAIKVRRGRPPSASVNRESSRPTSGAHAQTHDFGRSANMPNNLNNGGTKCMRPSGWDIGQTSNDYLLSSLTAQINCLTENYRNSLVILEVFLMSQWSLDFSKTILLYATISRDLSRKCEPEEAEKEVKSKDHF